LRPLTQQRFLEAWVIEEPPLPLSGWWPRERSPNGRPFMWGSAQAEFELPPMAAGTDLGIALRPAPGPDPVGLVLDGEVVVTIDGKAGEQRLWIRMPSDTGGRSSRLLIDRAHGYPPGDGDSRPLAVQVYEIRVLNPVGGWEVSVAFPWQREALQIEVEGAYDAERFSGAGAGMWLQPRALLRLPAADGRLRLHLWAPRPTPPLTEIRIAGRLAAGPLEVGPQPEIFEIEVLPGEVVDGRLEVEILSDAYHPAEDGVADPRELGVVLSDLEFEPRRPTS
jgi:hypothetical protein